MDSINEKWMKMALKLAHQALAEDEVPVGAMVICNDQVLSTAWNKKEQLHSPMGHAEILALELAAQKLGRWRLHDCLLVSTLEPCVMCCGAILQARIPRVIFGAPDPKGGGHTLFQLLQKNELNHQCEVSGGILANECGQILSDFFKNKRKPALDQ